MNNLSYKIKSKILSPTLQNLDDGDKLIARVLSTNPNRNLCDIQYLDKKGRRITVNGVSVRMYLKGIIGWFPSKYDEVIIEKMGNRFEIISMAPSDYSETKGSIKLENDIVSSSVGDGYCGNIF